MIFDITENINFDSDYYLYWIRKKSHKDMSKDGYIGVSCVPRNRLRQHNSCLSNFEKAIKQGYSSAFIKSFKDEDLVFEIVNCGSMVDVQNQEYFLRAEMNIGWNVAIGGMINGVCSRYKHGGTKNMKTYNKFIKILEFCNSKSLPIDFNFNTDCGFKLFSLHIEDRLLGKKFTNTKVRLIDEEKGLVLGNFYIEPMGINSDHDRWLFFDNKWWSKKEACLETGISINTVDKRLSCYNMSREEAVGFVYRPTKDKELLELGGKVCEYDKSSGFSKEDLIYLYDIYTSGSRVFKTKCKDKGVESANITRYFKRYGLESKIDRRTKAFRCKL